MFSEPKDLGMPYFCKFLQSNPVLGNGSSRFVPNWIHITDYHSLLFREKLSNDIVVPLRLFDMKRHQCLNSICHIWSNE